jgi:hypothetical protein
VSIPSSGGWSSEYRGNSATPLVIDDQDLAWRLA